MWCNGHYTDDWITLPTCVLMKNIPLHVYTLHVYVQVAKYGHLDHAELLLKYGADLHAQNNAGNTPLHVAASHGQVRGREISTVHLP